MNSPEATPPEPQAPSCVATRVAWVVASLGAGGIGPACQDAADGLARVPGWRCTVVSLHSSSGDRIDAETGVRFVSLGLRRDAPREFLRWLMANPQEIIVSNDVSTIEPGFPYFPGGTRHVVQVHDSLRRYRDVAVRNHAWIDGVICVAHHIEVPLRRSLSAVGFRGRLETVHNGAAFPPEPVRTPSSGTLRLLFVGNMDPLIKGILDLAPILERLRRLGIPVRLTVAGGRYELLERRLRAKGLDPVVTWVGRVPRDECYRLAANHDVLLMTSRREGFGMVTIEAMSMGCVPLAYDISSGSREIIEPGKSGLLVPLGDFSAVARELQSLHESQERWAELSKGAMRRVRQDFSQRALACRTAAFLRKLVAGTQSCSGERKTGFPSDKKPASSLRSVDYHRLPPRLRQWVRNRLGARPRLSHWIASR